MMSCAVLDNWYKISKIAFIMFFTSVKSLLIALNFFFFFLAVPSSMQDLSPPTRNQTCVPCIGSTVFTTRPPGKSPP